MNPNSLAVRGRTARGEASASVNPPELTCLNKLNKICNLHKPFLLRGFVGILDRDRYHELQVFCFHLVGLVLRYARFEREKMFVLDARSF
jgi:hypothetical protein